MIDGEKRCLQIQKQPDSTGIFSCYAGPGEGWNELQGGDWDIPQSAAAAKQTTCVRHAPGEAQILFTFQ